MAFAEELEQTLRQLPELEDAQIELEVTQDGRVGGFVLARSFEGMEQLARHDLIWQHLEQALTADQQGKIISLLTLTPDEAEDDEPVVAAGS